MAVPDDAPPREDWNREGRKRRCSRRSISGVFPGSTCRLIEGTPEIYEFPLVDRDPVEAWSFGRVTLIGDAAHPMQPTGSQAGSQAIVDARALTAALLDERRPDEALAVTTPSAGR